jgi:hypothetical protein
MLASRGSVNVDLVTQNFRTSCRVIIGPTALIVLLNDATTSLIDVEDAYYSRLQEPAKIVSHIDAGYVAKANVSLVILRRREDLGPEGLARGGFKRLLPVPLLVITTAFEIQGSVEVVNKFDPAELLLVGTGRFLSVYNASAVKASNPDTVFSGAVILVNRTSIEMLAPMTEGKS